jgi:hypothetical protein
MLGFIWQLLTSYIVAYLLQEQIVKPEKTCCSGKAQKQLYSKFQTRPLIREGATR